MLKRVLSRTAAADLASIWQHNVKQYGQEHAIGYLNFMDRMMDKIQQNPSCGKAYLGISGIRYLTMKRRPGGHGHIALFQANEEEVHIIRILHTAQNWHNPAMLESKT